MWKRGGFLLILTVLLTSCGLDYSIRTQTDPEQNFYKYETYTFLTDNDTTGVSRLNREVILFIEDEIANHILDLGMFQELKDPQLVIYYQASMTGINKNTASNRDDYKDLPGSGYSYILDNLNDYEKREGTLTINFYDRKRKKIVWQGTIVMELSDKPEKNRKYIAKALDELFAQYPIMINK
jgi:hypothetical protein